MKINNFKPTIIYIVVVGISVSLLLFFVACTWIGNDVKTQCQTAMQEYGGDCVESLSKTLKDESRNFRTRNLAAWALGQIGDPRALPILRELYTGNIPPREPFNDVLSQYELKKAINLIESGINICSWAWKGNFDRQYINVEKETAQGTVVIADRSDPYFPLAQEIAQSEKLQIAENYAEALELKPQFMILVTAPENLTEALLRDIGNTFKELDYFPALGFITGSTQEKARDLWERGSLANHEACYLGSDVEKDQFITEPILVDLNADNKKPIPLTKKNLIDILQRTDYFYWVRHVSETKWFWNTESKEFGEEDKLYPEDIPTLKAVVINTPSCGSFRPWADDSIALAFVDQGAAAYLGHVNSPFSNAFIMRDGFSVPGRTTWAEFPIGIIVQIQNRMTAKVVLQTPLYFMLGDPRIYLSENQPYEIYADTISASNERVISGSSQEQGVLSVKIENGAGYDFIKIENLDSASSLDVFYNNKIQFLDLGQDKYILFLHPGGDFTISLSQNPPFLWLLADTLLDALDYSWVALGVVYSPLSLTFLVLWLVLVILKMRRQKMFLKTHRTPFFLGFLMACIQVLYLLIRQNRYSVSASLVNYFFID